MSELSKDINFDLSQIADGGVQEKFSRELKKLSENILDSNTDAKAKRKITINLTYKPNDNRDAVDVIAEVKSTLAPQVGLSTTMLVGRDENTGVIAANELKSGTPGQTYFDSIDSTLKTDTGEPVDEVEENKETQSENVIDLQDKKA
ncbi:replication terminator protein [Companilactobacillus allii]|uniref:Replication terminator protein n=1 Tax=Companilactobacillus allii TaxID=1847728 RepID=A0A1P8Q4A1_9LACO|nr:replication terminator protein [Companilactobacillus allii]APX72698.1 replication terminator protein [Companilactobacillus allii]USQ69804.1 replication terminator protein [Companilactobacillus allii]